MGTMTSDPLVGQVLDERYRVDTRIARGGMATVYRAQDMRLDRTVALKAMHPSLAEDPSFVSRFIGEAKSAARLSHPNVVSVYDQGTDSGVVFLTMEYLPGRTVRDLLSEGGPLEPDHALGVMEAVLAALGAAHQAGYVHRDIKPENVLLSGDHHIKVADFGLARAIAASNHTKTSGLLIGTVAYLSPEQVARGDADTRSDVYSAGILLFELLTGTQPFRGETPLAVAYKHVNNAVPAPSSVVAGIPRELDSLVTAATQRDPDRRPADASGLLAVTTAVRERLRGATDADGVDTEALARTGNETLVAARDDLVPGLHETGPAEEGEATSTRSGRRGALGGALRTRRGLLMLTGTLIAALLASGVGYYLGWGRYTTAPDLAGMKVSAAVERARQLGFDVERADPEFSNRVPDGSTIATEPQTGERILRGGTITLIPSKGKRTVAIPDLNGAPVSEARQAIKDAGLAVKEVTRGYSSSVKPGALIRTKPKAGTILTVGSRVTLVSSAGVKVPDVVGESRDKATEILQDKDFEVSVAEKRYHPDIPAGAVIAQQPSGGGAASGSTVRLTTSLGPKPVPVPDVVGMNTNKASKTLEGSGFTVEVRDWPLPGHRVVKQVPEAGDEAQPGSAVTIYAW